MNAKQRLRHWREDPISFVMDNFKPEKLDDWQSEILAAFPHEQRIAVPAAKGCGKTCVEAWLMWNFASTRIEANIAATSISSDQLQDGLWKELAKWQHRSPFLLAAFEWQKTRVVAKERPSTWWMSARSWAKSADANAQSLTLAGLHADHMMFVLDESGGIPLPILATAEAALASGIECKLFQAGNTTTLDGPLHLACTTHAHLWKTVHVTGDPDDPKRSTRISKTWAREQIELFGRENPWVKVNVFGEFPSANLNSVLGPDEVRAAMARQLVPDDYAWAQKRLGVDVARFGDDRSVLFPRQGLWSSAPTTLRGERTTAIAAKVIMSVRDFGKGHDVLVTIDDTGHWGHGVIDNCVAAGINPIGVQFHAPAYDKRYKNRRAEMWLNMAEWVRRGGILPNLPELIGELTVPTYTFVNGQFLLEDKDIIKERLGRSPDLADALALTFAIPELPSREGFPLGYEHAGHIQHEWDPYASDRE